MPSTTRLTPARPVSVDTLKVDTRQRYVRVLEVRGDGLVSFEFAIGWPELFAELLLPQAAFDEFCTTHRVQRL